MPLERPIKAAERRAREVTCLPTALRHIGFIKPISIQGTAHTCGTLSTGDDSTTSVIDADGRAHDLDNLYVVDGSALPRLSRVNPALTIYAWGLRVADRLANRKGE